MGERGPSNRNRREQQERKSKRKAEGGRREGDGRWAHVALLDNFVESSVALVAEKMAIRAFSFLV